jgi:predicted aminopeptidase
VPYKGYFSLEKARKAARNRERKGLDTYLRPTAAFSTLGWFNDPLVSPLLRYDSVTLAGTVVHELLHNTIYLPGQAMFNESLAEFVGGRGAIAFFCDPGAEASPECARARADWHDELIFGRFLDGLVQRLDSLYSRPDLSREEKLRRREEVFDAARREFAADVQPRFESASYAGFLRGPLNNATLISRRLYYHRLDLFEAAYDRAGGELRLALDAILAAARSNKEDPYGGVERWVRGGVDEATGGADVAAGAIAPGRRPPDRGPGRRPLRGGNPGTR